MVAQVTVFDAQKLIDRKVVQKQKDPSLYEWIKTGRLSWRYLYCISMN